MAHAYEVALTWGADLLRAEVRQGTFEMTAGGAPGCDLPLPIEGRHVVMRGDGELVAFLPLPMGAGWTVDGAAGGVSDAGSLGDSIASVQLGGLEIRVQTTSPPVRVPRSGVSDAFVRWAAAHVAGYVGLASLLALNLPDSSVRTPMPAASRRPIAILSGLDLSPAPAFAVVPAAPELPVREEPQDARRHRAVRRHTAAVPADGSGSLPLAIDPRIPQLATGSIDEEIALLEDLEAESVSQEGAQGSAIGGQPGARLARQGPEPDQVGTCSRGHFEGLSARHGRTAAILACAPAPRLGSPDAPTNGHSVVLRDRGPSARLAAEIWSWSASRRRH